MPVYEVVPQTTVDGYGIGDTIGGISIGYCRRLCNSEKACDGFVWTDETDKNPATCALKLNTDTGRRSIAGSTLYIKGGNPSYWWLWLGIAVLLVILFLKMCKDSRR